MTTANEQLKQAATGGAMIVDWVLNNSQITPVNLRALLIQHGFDPTVVPDINQTKAVLGVARGWRQTHAGYSSKVLKDIETDETMFISVRKDSPGNRRNDAIQFCTLTWDKVNNQWGPTLCPSEHRAAVDTLVAKCDRTRTHLDCDFIRPVLIQAPLRKLGSVPFIRSSGGVQVVANTHADEVGRICDMVNGIGDCYMGAASANLTDTRTAQVMERSVQQGIMHQVTKSRAEIQAWRDRGTRLQVGSIGNRIEQFKDLRASAEMFAGCLQIRVDDLLAELDQAEDEAKELLDFAMDKKNPKAVAA